MIAAMSNDTLTGRPGPTPRTVRTDDGSVLPVPDGWELLPPGDAGLTRRVKANGPTWTIQEKRGRKTFSRGIWAPAGIIVTARADLAVERADPAYARKREADTLRREKAQTQYVSNFYEEVVGYLGFAPTHAELASRVARAVTDHATPVGSGTVARTKRIAVDQRAEAAVIAWLRHQTTTYDSMRIARVKGARREIRRQLAHASKQLLDRYRRGEAIPENECPLRKALLALLKAG